MSNVMVVCDARYFPGPEAQVLPHSHRLSPNDDNQISLYVIITSTIVNLARARARWFMIFSIYRNVASPIL